MISSELCFRSLTVYAFLHWSGRPHFSLTHKRVCVHARANPAAACIVIVLIFNVLLSIWNNSSFWMEWQVLSEFILLLISLSVTWLAVGKLNKCSRVYSSTEYLSLPGMLCALLHASQPLYSDTADTMLLLQSCHTTDIIVRRVRNYFLFLCILLNIYHFQQCLK
jgi:hypothetical protein